MYRPRPGACHGGAPITTTIAWLAVVGFILFAFHRFVSNF